MRHVIIRSPVSSYANWGHQTTKPVLCLIIDEQNETKFAPTIILHPYFGLVRLVQSGYQKRQYKSNRLQDCWLYRMDDEDGNDAILARYKYDKQ